MNVLFDWSKTFELKQIRNTARGANNFTQKPKEGYFNRGTNLESVFPQMLMKDPYWSFY